MEDRKCDEIRCAARRPHYIKGILYETCGSIIGALPDSEEESIYRCGECNHWFRVTREAGDDMLLIFEELPHRHFNFKQPVRMVSYDRGSNSIS